MSARLLVVDDDVSILDLYQELLEDQDYTVERSQYPFLDVTDVVALAPDLIILEYLFGNEAQGQRMRDALLADPRTTMIPMIVCTVTQQTVEARSGPGSAARTEYL